MNLIEKFNSYFIGSNNIDLSKRKVIKTAAGLAALTIIGTVTPKLLKAATLTIQEQINGGLIKNQTFYLTEPIVFDIPNTVILNCKFVATCPMPHVVSLAHESVLMNNCIVEQYQLSGGVGITIEPCKGNMATTFQSALDTVSNSDNKTLHLSSGIYNI